MLTNHRRFCRIHSKMEMIANRMVAPLGSGICKCYILPLEDFSGGGLRYSSMFAFPLGTKLDLTLSLNDSPLQVTAKVIRAQKNEAGCYDIGCKFELIDKLARKDIIRYACYIYCSRHKIDFNI